MISIFQMIWSAQQYRLLILILRNYLYYWLSRKSRQALTSRSLHWHCLPTKYLSQMRSFCRNHCVHYPRCAWHLNLFHRVPGSIFPYVVKCHEGLLRKSVHLAGFKKAHDAWIIFLRMNEVECNQSTAPLPHWNVPPTGWGSLGTLKQITDSIAVVVF